MTPQQRAENIWEELELDPLDEQERERNITYLTEMVILIHQEAYEDAAKIAEKSAYRDGGNLANLAKRIAEKIRQRARELK